MYRERGVLVVFSGPSGCGKGTVLKRAMEKNENIFLSVSATTRAPRSEDTDGVTYHFITKEQFQKLIAEGGMLEYAEYCGNYYGTPRKAVLDRLEAGYDVVLEIEVQGALQVKEKFPEAVMIFLLPPSIEELARRLTDRRTEDDGTIRKRMKTAIGEMKLAPQYDYVLINDSIEETAERFAAIISAERSKASRMKERICEVLYDA